jgi:hypothetical protein
MRGLGGWCIENDYTRAGCKAFLGGLVKYFREWLSLKSQPPTDPDNNTLANGVY